MEDYVSVLLGVIIATGVAVEGCGPTYAPISLAPPGGEVRYTCEIALHGRRFSTTVAERKGNKRRWLSLKGKAQAMAVSACGETLAVAVSPDDVRIAPQIVLIETDSMRVRGQWSLVSNHSEAAEDTGRLPAIHSVKRMALSDDSHVLAVQHMTGRPPGGTKPVVTVWNTGSGNCVREFDLPDVDPMPGTVRGRFVSSMVFSADRALVAISGAWVAKEPDSEATVFIQVYNVENGELVAALQPVGGGFVRRLCFNRVGSHLAGGGRARQETKRTQVRVWDLLGGGKTAEMIVEGKVRQIRWRDNQGVFEVWTDQGRRFVLSYE